MQQLRDENTRPDPQTIAGALGSSWPAYEKLGAGIATLEIAPAHKAAFASAKPIGKFIPLTLDIREEQDLADLLKIIGYKLSK